MKKLQFLVQYICQPDKAGQPGKLGWLTSYKPALKIRDGHVYNFVVHYLPFC